MKKLALDIEKLAVESFSPSLDAEHTQGTVLGHSAHQACRPTDTRSQYWDCVTHGMYTCKC